MNERIHVTVVVDTDELRKWADHHADRGHHGVAHVLYKAASDGESLSEQVIRTAVERAWHEGWVSGCNDQQYGDESAHPWTLNPYHADREAPK